MKIDYDKAVRLFEYDDACGCLRWKVSPRYLVNAGDKVGSQGKAGYITTKVEGVSYKVHRLIWLVCNGAMPDGEIDHVDRDKTNNHISNLRVVSRSTNCANRGVFSSSASGKRGIRQLPSGRWGVRIYYEKTVFNLGVFESADDAVTMRNGAEKILRGQPNRFDYAAERIDAAVKLSEEIARIVDFDNKLQQIDRYTLLRSVIAAHP